MIAFILETQWTRHALFWSLFLSLLFSPPTSSLHAQGEDQPSYCPPSCCPASPPCCSVDFIESEDQQQRSRLAAATATATIAGLTAGIIYVIACSGGRRRHCCRSSSCYSSGCYCYSSRSCSGGCCSGSSYSRCDSPSYSCYSGCGCGNKRGCGHCKENCLNTAEVPIGIAQGITGLGGRSKLTASPSTTLSGLFFPFFSFPERAKGSFVVFVDSPDGRRHSLGHFSLSYPQSSSLVFGPFTQAGLYTFGIRVEEEVDLPNQIQVGRFEIHLNGSSTETYDFHLPAHACIGYEPSPAIFELKSSH